LAIWYCILSAELTKTSTQTAFSAILPTGNRRCGGYMVGAVQSHRNLNIFTSGLRIFEYIHLYC